MRLTVEMIKCDTWKEPSSTVFIQHQSKSLCCEERLVVFVWYRIVRWQQGQKLGINDKRELATVNPPLC